MTKEKLKKYFWLKHEIIKQNKRLEKLKNRKQTGFVGDSVKDYKTGKGLPLTIQGYAQEDYTSPIMARLLEEEIVKNIEESENLIIEIEKFVQGVTEPKLRELLRSRYIDCNEWDIVGRDNYIAADYARRLVREFLKTLPNK